jgi:hypothetical protein
MNHRHGASRYWIQEKKNSDKNVVLPRARKNAVKGCMPITGTLELRTINFKGCDEFR